MIGRRILIAPEIRDATTLQSLIGRLGHYFSHVELHGIQVLLDPALDIDFARTLIATPVLPEGFDPDVREGVERINDVVQLGTGAAGLNQAAATSDVVLFWDATAMERSPWKELRGQYRHNRTRFVVDWQHTRTEGAAFADAAMALANRSRQFNAAESTRFQERTQRLRGADRAYLVATGPSARSALDVDMSDGMRIVCNTVVLDDDLMQHVAPDIVTFADPIFHFGPSTYAHEFQRALDRQAARHDFTIVTIERFAGLLRRRLPHLAERIVGIRLCALDTQNLDLANALAVRPYPNILTMLMLPLAATFARDISMIGFDGRSADETYYWRHGGTVQLVGELQDIKLVHPGFFDLDFGDYYEQHVHELERLLVLIEQRGASVRNLSPSFMTPLRRRVARPGLDPHVPARPNALRPRSDVIISITPDWVDRFGHFGPWEHAVGSAARDVGYEYRSLASKARVPHGISELQAFTHVTIDHDPFETSLFEREVREQLSALVGTSHRSFVTFYTADVWHLPSLLAVAHDHPETIFAVNLMRAHPSILEARTGVSTWAFAIGELLTRCLESAAGTNLVICIDTEAIATELEFVTGIRVDVWPMIMVADPHLLAKVGVSSRHDHLRLVAPIQTQLAKGFADIVSFAERITDRLHRGEWSLATRFLAQPSGTAVANSERAERLRELGCELIEGSLDDEHYAQMIGEAHVILLPYHRDPFRTRTSAVLLDAIAAGKPVVAVRETWTGGLVERYELGSTYRDGDLDDLHAAVERTVSNLDVLTRRVVEQRDEILDAFRPARLIEFLETTGIDRRGGPPSEEAVARTRRTATMILDAHRGVRRERADREVIHQVEIDDQRRLRDDLWDQVVSLERANRWHQAQIGGRAFPLPRSMRRIGAYTLRRVGVDPGRVKDLVRRGRRRIQRRRRQG